MMTSLAKTARVLRATALNVAAVGGALCIALVILAYAFNVTLIMFKTGSMHPTIPAGSVALVREIPASEIHVGDIVTVDRTGKLPVTHRVTSIEPASGESRTFTMRGDANAVDDVAPYTAATVRLVLGSLPGLANVIVWFSTPLALAAITVAAAGLVTWAFWPRRTWSSSERPRADARGRARHRATVPLGLLAVMFLPLAFPAFPASASEIETVVHGSVLRLVSVGDPALMGRLRPGVPVHWQVGVSANAPHPGTVTLSLSVAGDLADSGALDVAVSSCRERWDDAACPSGGEPLVSARSVSSFADLVSSTEALSLTSMPSGEERWLLFTVSVTSLPAPMSSATLLVHARGFGDDIVSGGVDDALANTGATSHRALLMSSAAIACGLSVALAATARQRKRM